jgi:hypothetical protein
MGDQDRLRLPLALARDIPFRRELKNPAGEGGAKAWEE